MTCAGIAKSDRVFCGAARRRVESFLMELRNGLRNGKHCAERPELPAWSRELLGSHSTHECGTFREVCVEASLGDGWALLHARVADADALSALDLQKRSCDAYAAVGDCLRRLAPLSHAVRFWNFIPGIGMSMGDGLDRYMVFNAGRFAAFHGWPSTHTGDPWTATASAVGHNGRDFVVWCLASRNPGVPVENPRQTPVRHYSDRYGPMPPSFARATILPGVVPPDEIHSGNRSADVIAETPAILLIGGTASICGEHSRHEGDLTAQVEETLANLDTLVRAAMIRLDPMGNQPSPTRVGLRQLLELRVYWVRPGDRDRVERLVRGRFMEHCGIEWVQADLCRPELLVEIEGVASLGVASSQSATVLVKNHA